MNEVNITFTKVIIPVLYTFIRIITFTFVEGTFSFEGTYLRTMYGTVYKYEGILNFIRVSHFFIVN